MDKIKKILQFAMKMERQAQVFYGFYAEQVQDSELKNLFNELEEVEKDHYRLLKEKYDALMDGKDLQIISWVVDDNSGVKHTDIFSVNTEILSLDNSLSDITVLRMAYLIENDFAEFYKRAVGSVDVKEVKDFLQELADWEEGHRDLFYKRYQNVKMSNWDQVIEAVLE